MSEGKWNNILDQIITGLQAFESRDENLPITSEEIEKTNNAFKLLAKYWNHLWS
jgi:hypothetical protein